MKVILTTNIKKLGSIGDIVSVKDGYARNFLFPNNMALRNNKKNLEHYENIKEEMAEKELSKKQEAEKLIELISNIKIEFKKEADEKNQLYGSISKKEIIDYLLLNQIKIKSDDLVITEPIKNIGQHKIVLNPYINISKEFLISIIKN